MTENIPTPPSEVSVVVAAHRDGPMLEACLRAIAALDPAPREVIVAVDGGCQKVIAAVERHGFRSLSLPDAPGVSAARNAGAAAASGSLLAFLDSDVEASPNFISQALKTLSQNPWASAAFGSYDARPGSADVVSRYRNLLHHYTHQIGRRDALTFWAACGVCDAKTFRMTGGFDQRFQKPSVEDIEFGYRLRHAGHRIVLDPEWQIRHLKRWELGNLFVTDVFLRAMPWTLLLLRQKRFENNLNINNRSRASALLSGLALTSLGLSMTSPRWLLIALLCMGTMVGLNRAFYRFLVRSEGWFFAFLAVPLHSLYLFSAKVGYALGFLAFHRERLFPAAPASEELSRTLDGE